MAEEVYGIPKEWELLGELDESADYEVDITAIYRHNGEFILATASGCSCWDGDYGIERFKTLDDLEKSLMNDDREYNPSFKGVEKIVAEAREKIKEG